jgi:serine-type D-Ala-D-Ala carboxypeptidase/endopeptidase (penicillin-binding protein 4)
LPNPALLCAEHLATSMIKLGIKCDPKKIISLYDKNYSIGDKQLLHTHFSPGLDKIVYTVNQNSNNLYCESLLRTMGNGDMQRGVSISKDFCAKKGGDSSEVFMKDGSGLSRVNSCTPSLQAFLLYKISQDSILYQDFNASLPVSGKNVSMSNIGKGTILENNLRAKTGYLTRARAYCGYVSTKSGKQLSFSVMINNYNCSAKEAKLRLEKFMLSLSEL